MSYQIVDDASEDLENADLLQVKSERIYSSYNMHRNIIYNRAYSNSCAFLLFLMLIAKPQYTNLETVPNGEVKFYESGCLFLNRCY